MICHRVIFYLSAVFFVLLAKSSLLERLHDTIFLPNKTLHHETSLIGWLSEKHRNTTKGKNNSVTNVII